MLNKINFLFVSLFGIGKIKKIPGSFASLSTTLFLFFLFHILNVSPNIILFAIIIVFLISLYAVNVFIKDLTNKDPKEIVIDEFIGQMLPLLSLPVYETLYPAPQFYYCVTAFILFRIFDIWKPFPIDYVDNNIEGALGIILDDIVAGIYTIIILTIIFFFLGA